MKTARQHSAAAVRSVLVAALGACGGDRATAPGPVVIVEVTPTAPLLASIGEQITLGAVARDAAGRTVTGQSFTWVSSANAIATVSNIGVVTAIADGAATITATANGVSGSATATVRQTATKLAFVLQPTEALLSAPMPTVTVELRDARDNVVPNASNVVTLALGMNPTGATLSRAPIAPRLQGVTYFAELSVDREGSGYTLVASSSGLPSVTSAPFDVRALRLRSVTAGGELTCGVATDDAAFCWGIAYGDHGVPRRVAGTVKFASVSAGGTYACGIALDATAYCWGSLVPPYDPQVHDSYTPARVAGGLSFSSVSSGQVHVCGVATDHRGYCWGANAQLELGAPTTDVCGGAPCSRVPLPVSGNLLFTSISAGDGFSCGLTTDTHVYCWGENGSGQIGDGDAVSPRAAPSPVASSLTWSAVTAGESHSCAIATTGEAYCWGRNDYGQLGLGIPGGPLHGTPALVAGGVHWSAISAGARFTCGIAQSGAAYCWGANGNSELGDGSQQDRFAPTPVSSNELFASVSAGNQMHSCALTTQNVAYCWGFGALGGGLAANEVGVSPVRVIGQP